MEEDNIIDEEFIEHIEEEEITHLVDRSMLTDCCIKTRVKKYINYLVYKPLSYIESWLINVYQFMFMLTLLTTVLKYNIVQSCLTWVFMNILSEQIIGLLSMVINSIFVMCTFDYVGQVIAGFSCKCD